MSRRLLLACAPALAVTLTFGCGAILGIPGDEGRADDSEGGGPDANLGPEVMTGDEVTSLDANLSDVKDGSATDSRPPPSCDLAKSFATPVLLTTVSTAGYEGSPKLSEDELTIYYDGQRDPEPYFDLYMATRSTISDSFGAPTKMSDNLNTTDMHEFAPNVTADGLAIYFEREDPTSFVDNFWTSTRPAIGQPWAVAQQVAGVNRPEYQGKLSMHGNGNDLYFSKKGTGTTYHLYAASKPTGGQYVIRQLTGTLGTAGTEEYASAVSEDGLTLYFSRSSSAAGEEIWKAVRNKTTDDFEAINVTLESVLNSPQDDEPSWLSPDGCRLYMQSTRTGLQDIYVAAKPK